MPQGEQSSGPQPFPAGDFTVKCEPRLYALLNTWFLRNNCKPLDKQLTVGDIADGLYQATVRGLEKDFTDLLETLHSLKADGSISGPPPAPKPRKGYSGLKYGGMDNF